MIDKFDDIREIEEVLSELIELGLVEAYGVDENGEFMYRATDKEWEKKVYKKAEKRQTRRAIYRWTQKEGLRKLKTLCDKLSL